MQTRRLGNSNLDLTPIGFGAWAIGGDDWGMGWGPQDDADSIAAIHEALDCGVNWIDTAHAYGFGKSEEVVGRAVKEWSGGRVIIATKCGVLPNEVRFPYRDANRTKILEEVEGSLKRLQVDCIDLYQIHWPELDEKVEEAWQTLLDLKEQGKIRWPAVCNYGVSHLERASKLGPVTSLQPRYSLLNRQIETEGHMDWCRENNCGIVSYSPMESGLLTNKTTPEWIDALPKTDWRQHKPDHPVARNIHPPRREHYLKFLGALNDIAAASDHSIAQLAVAWTLRRSEITSAIVGARRTGQIAETVKAGDWQLSEEELNSIEAAHAEFTLAVG